jgi:hypothetical protein
MATKRGLGYVMFASTVGSIGKHSIYRTDGPFKNNPAFKVEYHYGLDVNGKPIKDTAHHGNASPINFLKITKEEYVAYTQCRAWSPAQERVRKRIINRLKKEHPWL